MSREHGHLPVAVTDGEDNDSIPDNPSNVPDPEPALDALRDAYGNLADRLHSPGVIEHLYSGRLLTKIEYDSAKSKESNYDKNTEVLGALIRKGPAEVVKFCQVLFEQNQHNCGRTLLEALNRRGVDVSSVVIPSQTPPGVRSTSPKYYIEMEDLNDEFITLVREVKKVGGRLAPADLRTICIQLLSAVSSTKRNVQEDIDALRRCDGDYIDYLQPYWDSLDCNLLHRLIRQLKKQELTEDWEKYRTQVKEACTATLEECRRSLPQGRELLPNQISVGFQTTKPPNDVTVQKMLDLKDFLMKRMGLEEADFAGFTNSDVTLFFTVSRSHLPFLVRLCALHRRSLQDFSITVVFVPGEFIYDVITDQEFPYPEATSLRNEPVLQLKDLKEEMLRQFDQLQTSKAAHDRRQVVAVFEKVQQELISAKKKLDVVEEEFVEAEKMLRTSTVSWSEDKVDATSLRSEPVLQIKDLKEEMLHQFERLQTSKKWSESDSKSNTKLKKVISDVEGLLGQSSDSGEDLQDKIRILVEEWSKISEHEPEDTSLSVGQLHQLKDLKEEMVHPFEQLQTSQRPEEARKIWKEEEDASSLHYAQEKLITSYVTLVNVFKHHLEVYYAKGEYVPDSLIVLCQATLARKGGTSRLPSLSNFYEHFGNEILDNTTIFDIEMIRVVANQIQQPALTEAIEKYEAVLKPLMEASIAELTERYIVEPVLQDPSKQAYKLVLKCPSDNLVGDLYFARYYLEKYLGIPEARLLTFPRRWQ